MSFSIHFGLSGDAILSGADESVFIPLYAVALFPGRRAEVTELSAASTCPKNRKNDELDSIPFWRVGGWREDSHMITASLKLDHSSTGRTLLIIEILLHRLHNFPITSRSTNTKRTMPRRLASPTRRVPAFPAGNR